MSDQSIDSAPSSLQRLARSLVAILTRFHAPVDGLHARIGSGFVVDLDGQWFIITAQHVLTDIEKELIDDPNTWFELRTTRDPHEGQIPIRFLPERSLLLGRWNAQLKSQIDIVHESNRQMVEYFAGDDPVDGLDVAAHEVADLYKTALLGAGVEPLPLEWMWDWSPENLLLLERDDLAFGLAGFPGRDALLLNDGSIPSLNVRILGLQPKELTAPKIVFEPHWDEVNGVGSVGGMSGGPVFLVAGEELRWFGLQSAELVSRDDRPPAELYVCDARYLVRAVKWLRMGFDA